MKKIKLTQGKHALVDDDDYEELSKHKWFAVKGYRTYYAKRNIRKPCGKQTGVRMHRQILGLDDLKVLGDHIDHNGLNNQRSNLRAATSAENSRNTRCHVNKKSKYKGVKIRNRKEHGRIYVNWIASILVNGKIRHTKQFPYTAEGEIMAAKAYDEMAKMYFGEFANLNFK